MKVSGWEGIPLLIVLSLTGKLSMVYSAPHEINHFPPLFDDQTATVDNHHDMASNVNRQLSTVPRMDFLPSNETPDLMQKRKFNEEPDYIEEEEPPPPPPPMRLFPWMRYRQTYYNPFIYGGPNGPPTFVPQFGVWPTHSQGYQSQPGYGR